jgi:hypothetical protein
MRAAKNAAAVIDRLPEEGESIHMVLSGIFRTWDLVPACLMLAGCRCEEMLLTTLGYDQSTLDGVLKLLDEGTLQRVAFVTSAVFCVQQKELTEEFRRELTARGQRFIGVRNHTKIMLLALADGRRIVIESSGNLRSCHSMEQSVITQDAGLYEFHRGWIEECFTNTSKRKTSQIIR